MKSEDLLALLDLKDTRAGPKEVPALVVSATSPAAQCKGSATAIDVDSWALRRGNDLFVNCERIHALDLDAFAIADCHAAAFDPEPELLPDCRDKTRFEFFKALLDTSEYRALHHSTKLDASASEIAAVHFAEEFDRFRKDGEQAQPEGSIEREVAVLRAVNRALVAARDEVEECREAIAAFGFGTGGPGRNDAKAIADLFRRVRNDPTLRAICSLAGRYRRLAQSRQRRKTRHGLDDIVGVELGGDLGRILPHELVKLATPPFEIEAMRRLIERQLMSREFHATEPVAKGPIIVVVDESGSMAGEPIHSAKAIALALAWIARQQRRWCALVAYSGDSGERLLPLPPARWDESNLADWLIAFIGRGSSLDVPVRELPRMYADLKAPVGDTDVIVVTDCICRIPEGIREAFTAWKRSVQARLITIAIGDNAGDLTHVSDEVHLVRTLAIGEEAVGRVLSI